MNDDIVDRSAILELATYVMCNNKGAVEENMTLKEGLGKLKSKLLSEEMTEERKQDMRYIEQIERAIKHDPSIAQITVNRTSFDQYSSPMDAVCFQDGDAVYVQFRGTPPGGWVQNPISYGADIGEFMADDGMSSQIQNDGLAFFDSCARDFALGAAASLIVGGHSQGGNVAEYVTMMSDYGQLIDACISLDAPNHSHALEQYIKENYGEDHFKSQSAKITAINGNNDYVNMQGQVSFAGKEYYIDTNDEWAKENGHEGLQGYHDLLYMMDRARGGLILRRDQLDTLEQDIYWKKLPIGEYAEILAELPTEEQIEFMKLLPIEQQAQLFALLPIGQQLLMQAELPQGQAERILGQFTERQKEEMKTKFAKWQEEEEQKKQPHIMAELTEEQKAENRREAEANSEQSLKAREYAEEEIRIAKQAYAVQRRQTGKQGETGMWMEEVVKNVNNLTQSEQDGSTKTAMGILELLMGSKQIEDLKRAGIDLEAIDAFMEYGLPAISAAMMENKELTEEMLKEVLPEGLKHFAGVFVNMVNAAVPGAIGFYEVIKNMMKKRLTIKAILLINQMQAFAVEKEEIKESANGIAEGKWSDGSASSEIARYMDDNAYINVNTDKLRGYAMQTNSIINRLKNRADELKDKAKKASAKADEEEDEEAKEALENAAESYRKMAARYLKGVPDLEKVSAYFVNVAGIFERVEAKIRDRINGFGGL